MIDYKKYEDYIRSLAHIKWILEGRPNGEIYKDSEFGLMKIKDIHWHQAELEAEIALVHGPGTDW